MIKPASGVLENIHREDQKLKDELLSFIEKNHIVSTEQDGLKNKISLKVLINVYIYEREENEHFFSGMNFAENIMRRYEINRLLFSIYSSNWKHDSSGKELNELEYIKIIILLGIEGLEKNDLRYLNTSLKILDSKITVSSLKSHLRKSIYSIIKKNY